MARFPYGISNFKQLVSEDYIYIDRTPYLEQIEQMSERYLFFVRPRRFGKSLFVSVCEYYYDIRYKEEFDALFGQFYIGQNPTKNANQYLVLKFDFSGIDTSSFENTTKSFLKNVQFGVMRFLGNYPELFNMEEVKGVKDQQTPSDAIQYLLNIYTLKSVNRKIYLLIDEYDHFANEILSFRFEEFSQMISRNGFVRKFYEAIKVGTQEGVIDKLFVTGISPLTLDSLTSGFNIGTNITLSPTFNEMMGFTEKEVEGILLKAGVAEEVLGATIDQIRLWYNGYLFSEEALQRVYNSDMVLYFAKEYATRKAPPKILLDPNIASDYYKVRRIFKIKNKEQEHLKHLDTLLKTGSIKANLVRQYQFEKRFDGNDFISLLFYSGIITIRQVELFNVVFEMPNYVTKELYYQYFYQIILEQTQLGGQQINILDKINSLALDNDMQPLVAYIQKILTELSVRDKVRFDEKHVKTIFTSVLYATQVYTIFNEFEVKKSAEEKGFVDILLLERPPLKPNFQFIIEFKYLQKAQAAQKDSVKKRQLHSFWGI